MTIWCAHWLALEKGKAGEVYNVAASHIRPMGEWLKMLLRLTPVEIKMKVDSARLRTVEPQRLLVNSEKFRRRTGWRETVPPETMFQDVLNWWRSHV